MSQRAASKGSMWDEDGKTKNKERGEKTTGYEGKRNRNENGKVKATPPPFAHFPPPHSLSTVLAARNIR